MKTKRTNRRGKMRKVVINSAHGGFGLSHEGVMEYARLKGCVIYAKEIRRCEKDSWTYTDADGEYWHCYDIPRDDPTLVQVVELLSKDANDNVSELKVVEIPDDVEWQIEEYDGVEWVAEKHRRWS